jgi:hypothetical protein
MGFHEVRVDRESGRSDGNTCNSYKWNYITLFIVPPVNIMVIWLDTDNILLKKLQVKKLSQ